MESLSRSDRPTLARELSEFFVELSIALHRHSMYPSGHPALTPAIESVTRRAEKLLHDRPSIAFGIARRELIIDGVTTDPDQPVLRRLADGLHRHHIGALSIMPGIDAHELGEALRALSAEPEREGPVGLKPDVVNWPHICCRLLASSRRHRGRQPSPLPTTTLELTLGEEAEAFRWLQHEVQSGGSVPLLEAEAVVRSLSLAMHGDSRMVLPLLKLKEFDQYTTTHSLNVAVLAMGLAESLGCRPREIRAIGIAGLQHDIGKIRIPLEVLTKPAAHGR